MNASKYACPKCGESKLAYPDVKGEFGWKDTNKYICHSCKCEFPAKLLRVLEEYHGGILLENNRAAVIREDGELEILVQTTAGRVVGITSFSTVDAQALLDLLVTGKVSAS